jgi:hypothetical protein
MSITGSSSIRRLKDVAIVVNLDKLAPVGGWAPGRRVGRRLDRFAKMGQDLQDRSRLAGRNSAATAGCQECEGQGWFHTRKPV